MQLIRPCRPLLRPLINSCCHCRTFTSTSHLQKGKPLPKSEKYKLFKGFGRIPPYPYGPSQWFKQSNRALYGGARPMFGNNVSKKNEIKTRRRFNLNIQHKKLYSKGLNRRIRVRLTAKVLRTIDKVGGLDEYLLGHKPARLKELGPRGWALRWRLLQIPHIQKRIEEERRALGLAGDEDGDGEGAVESEGVAKRQRRKTPEELAKADYEKVVRDKNGKLLGTEPGRWRLLHVLYMRRLDEERRRVEEEEASSVGVVESGAQVGEGVDVDADAVIAREVRELDNAMDEEEYGMAEEERDRKEYEAAMAPVETAEEVKDGAVGNGKDSQQKETTPETQKVDPGMLQSAKRSKAMRKML